MDSKTKRRSRMVRLAVVVAGCLMATGYFTLGSNGWSAATKPAGSAAQMAANVDGQMTEYSSGDDKIPAYIAKPAGSEKHPAVIVVYDRDGLTEDAKAITRRFAEAGFVALAPD